MLTVRCSTRLLKDLGVPDAPESSAPESVLGDWYATVLQLRPRPVVLLVNEPTRLAVVMPVRDFGAPGEAIAAAILHVLADLGAARDAIARERLAMAAVSFARPVSRGMTAATNELTLHFEALRERSPHLPDHAASLALSQIEIDVPGHGRRHPADVAMRLLARAGD